MEASLQQRGGVEHYTTYNPDDGSFEVLGLDRPWTAKLAHCSKTRALLVAVTALAVAAVVYVVTAASTTNGCPFFEEGCCPAASPGAFRREKKGGRL